MIVLRLKPGKAKKIKNHYFWVFSDEIDEIIGSQEKGIANLFSDKNEFLGKGFFNPNSSKSFMLLTPLDEEIDKGFFLKRISKALDFRKPFIDSGNFRLVNAESDFLPGLIIDKYGEYFIIQLRNSVIERYLPEICESIKDLFNDGVKGIYERSDFESISDYELSREVRLLYGTVPDTIEIEEFGIKYLLFLKEGQKTGFFLDQKTTRKKMTEMIKYYDLKGKRGLDLFCCTGSFALNMAKNGMFSVGIDKSITDIESAIKNAEINLLSEKTEFVTGDVFNLDFNKYPKFKLIIIDPPSLIKSKKDIPYGKKLFAELFRKGIEFCERPAIIALCSCAYHIGWNEMEEAIRIASFDMGAKSYIIDQNTQSGDHPWLVHKPETLYLKCFWVKVE